MQRFIDHSVVTDTKTGLAWTKATIAEDVTFEKAKEAVEALGEGWRLPTVDELFSLIDHGKHKPAIDTKAFPDTKNDCYWTSTPCAWNEAAVWVVYFGRGYVDGYHRSDSACVRAVRSGQ